IRYFHVTGVQTCALPILTQSVDKKLDKLKYRLNLILIAGMCSMTLAPCVIFYFRGEGKIYWMMVFIAMSYLVSRLSRTFYDKFQISRDTKIYKSLGVDKFKKFSTNGNLSIREYNRIRYLRVVNNFS